MRERVITLLRAIRKLPEAEFEKHTIELANEMIGAMLPQRPSPDDMAAAAQSGANQGGKGPQDTQAAQRVKTKMMIIYEPYQEMRGRKQDTTIVDGYLARTRKMISLGNYVEAEKAVDQALKLMDITPTAAQLQKGATNNVASPAKQQPKPKQ